MLDNGKQVEQILSKVNKARDNRKLIGVVVIWQSPTTNGLEHREAFFTESAEAMLWENIMKSKYTKLGYTHNIYTV